MVLFFALVALVAIMLAAVALIRSVDTSTLIAGNLAFKQAATSSADAGTEGAITYLAALRDASVATNPMQNAAHSFNTDNAAAGYYASADPTEDMTSSAKWNAVNLAAIPDVVDSSGNTVRYLIQRMCRQSGVVIPTAGCLFSGALVDTNGQNVPLPQEICSGPGCPAAGQTPIVRITTRVSGPKNTVSYVQAFVY